MLPPSGHASIQDATVTAALTTLLQRGIHLAPAVFYRLAIHICQPFYPLSIHFIHNQTLVAVKHDNRKERENSMLNWNFRSVSDTQYLKSSNSWALGKRRHSWEKRGTISCKVCTCIRSHSQLLFIHYSTEAWKNQLPILPLLLHQIACRDLTC